MSHRDLTSLLETLAEEVDQMPQREYSGPAWARAQRLRRRRLGLAAAAAVVLVGVPVALLVPRGQEPVPPAEPTYSETPLRSRAAHTATLLHDGRVLVVGGCATDGCTTAEGAPVTEYYVPGQGFTAGPDLVQPRQGHTATLLADGRVLIAGGWAREGAPAIDSAEVYQPRMGRFEAVGSLNLGRGGHIATALPDGRVLIAGGETAAGSTETAELFDPESGTFTPAAPMPSARHAAVDTVLPDGRVLVVGGRDSDGDAVASALLYDPGSDTWQSTGSMSTPRDKLALAPLPDGRVLVLGGTPDDRRLLRSTEIYDPATGEFEPGPPMDIERYKFIAVPVDELGRIIIAGGTQLAVYDSDQFRPIPGTAADSPRWSPTVTVLPDGAVLVIGGYDDRIDLYPDALLISASLIAG
jgi:hypothetical protein